MSRTIISVRIIKKILVWIAASILSFCLFTTINLWVFSQTAMRPDVIKGWLQKSGIYENVVPALAEISDNPSSQSSIPLKDEAIIGAGKKAFSREVLQGGTEQAIDQFTAWLRGDTKELQITVNLSDARSQFAKGIGDVAAARLASLPICGVEIPDKFDVFQVACLPPTVDPQVEGKNVANELTNSKEFLGTGIITNETLRIKDQSTPFYVWAPKVYRWRMILVTAAVSFTVLLVCIIVFLSTSRRNGLKRTTRTFAATTLVLITVSVIVPYLSSAFAPASQNAADKAFLDKVISPVINQLEHTMQQLNITASIVLAVLTVIGITILVATRPRKPAPVAVPPPEMPVAS